MDILYDNRIVKSFIKKIVPVLQARGLPIDQTDEAANSWLEKWFSPEIAIWGVSIQVPECNNIYLCMPHKGKGDKVEAELFDTRVSADFANITTDNSVSILIHNTQGVSSYGEIVTSKKQHHSKSITRQLILLSGKGITVLIEPFSEFGCFIACDIWADEKLPLLFAINRPESSMRTKDYNLMWTYQSWETVTFASKCLKCDGDGVILCHKCEGSGIFKPEITCPKCNGDGNFNIFCNNCNGSGRVKCKKCNGSGDHYSAKGHRYDCSACNGSGYWSCNRCNGNGFVTLKCTACSGEGVFHEKKCIACEGLGEKKCYTCHGTGIVSVSFRERNNVFVIMGKKSDDYTREPEIDVPRHNVFLYDFRTGNKIIRHAKQVESIVAEIKARAEMLDNRTCKIEKFCELIAPITQCLTYSRDAAGELIRHPIQLCAPESTDKRRLKKVVYAYSFVRPVPAWLNKKEYPFQPGTPLKINPPIQQDGEFPDNAQPVLYDIDFEKRRLLIQFPVDINRGEIDNIEITPAIPNSSENTQIKYLKQWIERTNYNNPVFESMTLGNSDTNLQKISLKNLDIEKWETQLNAVEIGCGNTPLFLIKGPPGTGKTTIIVEIVQQIIEKGGRVLVCSQTHQAVRNVLERLHNIGNIPMLRYARDEGKLSELELHYLAGGPAFDPNHIVTKARNNLDNIQTQTLSLEKDITTLLPAYDEVKNLDKFIMDMDARRKKVEKQFDDDTVKCNDDHNLKRSAIKFKYDKLEEGYNLNINKLNSELNTVSDLIKRKNSEIAAYNSRLSGKIISTEKNSFSWVADILPAVITTDSSIARRKNIAEGLLKEKQNLKNNLSKDKHSYEEKLSDAIQERKRNNLEINDSQTTLLTSIDKNRTDNLFVIERELCTGRYERIKNLKDAQIIAIKNGLQKEDDFNLESWTKCLQKMKDRLISLKGKLEFCEKWTGDLDDNKENIIVFLNQQVKVFFSTCVGLAGLKKDIGQYNLAKFDLAIIDEAGHATIPETIIPLSFAKRAILIGDEKQLPPIIGNNLPCNSPGKNMEAEPCVRDKGSCWLEYSLFEQLWTDKTLPLPKVMLNTQFRMHPTIAQFVSDAFYDGALKTAIKDSDRHFTFGEFQQPICLISTSAYGNERHDESQGKSWKNHLEAKMVVRVIEHLQNHLKNNDSKKIIEVGIISPYAAQTALLKKELEPLLNTSPHLKMTLEDIASVDKYQGSERDIIIASFVRSPRKDNKGSLRFVHDLKRMNVAFSRARRILIFIGDIDALCSAKGDDGGKEILKKFHDYVKDHGRILHVWEKREEVHD